MGIRCIIEGKIYAKPMRLVTFFVNVDNIILTFFNQNNTVNDRIVNYLHK